MAGKLQRRCPTDGKTDDIMAYRWDQGDYNMCHTNFQKSNQKNTFKFWRWISCIFSVAASTPVDLTQSILGSACVYTSSHGCSNETRSLRTEWAGFLDSLAFHGLLLQHHQLGCVLCVNTMFWRLKWKQWLLLHDAQVRLTDDFE